MIKRILIDIDDTLLTLNINKILKEYDTYLKPLNIKGIDIYNLYGDFENTNLEYTDENVLKYFHDNLSANITLNHLNDLREIFANNSSLINDDTDYILNKLSEKYEIVALSNWYSKDQSNRLEKVDILKYFTKVYGVDNLGRKPYNNTYINACKPYKLNECIMIGDNIVNDVSKPHILGIKSIYFNPLNNKSNYKSINSLNELIDLLVENQ